MHVSGRLNLSGDALAETPCAPLSPVGRLCGAVLAKRSTSRQIEAGLGATVAGVSLNGNQKSLAEACAAGSMAGGSAIQPLNQGKAVRKSRSGVTPQVCALTGVQRSGAGEGAAKSAYLQSIGA